MPEYTTEKKILLWLQDHPDGGTSLDISRATGIAMQVIDMTLVNLSRQGLAHKIPGKPPRWKRGPG